MSVITRKVVAFHIFAATIVWFALNAGSIARGADEEVRLHLTNGDRISGTIVADEEDYLVLKNDLFGQVRISKVLVGKKELLKAEIAESEQKKQRLWQAEVALGVGVSEGNTVKSSYAGDFIANRKTDHDEFTLKGSGLYASTKRDPDTEKWYGMIRYAYNFWEQKLYNFYKFESDHDKFSNVYVRLLPSAGIGYWFSKERAFKGLLELAVGYENTYFMDDSSAKTEIVLVPRFFAEARLFGDATLSQDLVFYPSLNYFGDYRLQSETSLKNPLSEKLFLRLSLIDNYNSNPEKTGTLKNDLQFLTTL